MASYCEAWKKTEATVLNNGLRIEKVHIEDIACAPAEHAKHLCQQFRLDVQPALFDGASLSVLSAWCAKCCTKDQETLEQRLGGWAWEFGYRDPVPTAIGPSCSASLEAEDA